VDIEPLAAIGYFALAVLVIGWLVVSFSPAGPRRAVVEWVAATAMFMALLCLFVHLVLRAIESDNTLALVAFGFLCTLFGGGLIVSLYHTITAVKGGGDSGPSATN